MEDGAEIASNLDALYDYMIHQIYKANQDNLAEPIDDVIGMLREINLPGTKFRVNTTI